MQCLKNSTNYLTYIKFLGTYSLTDKNKATNKSELVESSLYFYLFICKVVSNE